MTSESSDSCFVYITPRRRLQCRPSRLRPNPRRALRTCFVGCARSAEAVRVAQISHQRCGRLTAAYFSIFDPSGTAASRFASRAAYLTRRIVRQCEHESFGRHLPPVRQLNVYDDDEATGRWTRRHIRAFDVAFRQSVQVDLLVESFRAVSNNGAAQRVRFRLLLGEDVHGQIRVKSTDVPPEIPTIDVRVSA